MRRVVCISRADGAGGDEVGKLVADRLGFFYVDAEIVARAAARGGIDPGVVADAERRRSLVRRVLDAFAETGGSGWGGFAPAATDEKEPAEDDVQALIREAIAETVERGDVVIGGHAASYAVEPNTDCLRVFVTASPTTRKARAEVEHTDAARADRFIKDSDAGRADYLRRFYDISGELPTHYDLVVNTDTLSLEAAAALISHAASEL